MPSNYALYIKEREGKDIIEDVRGFATYEIYGSEAVYIVDIFVRKEFRNEGIAKSYADAIASIARDKGIKLMLGSVDPRANGASASEKVLIAYGMAYKGTGPDGLRYFSKEIV